MTVTLAQARASLRDALNEPQARAWTDNYLDSLLVDGCNELAKTLEYLETSVDLSVTVAENQPAMPVDVIRIYLAEWESTGSNWKKTLDYADYNVSRAVNWINTTALGVPSMVSYWGAVPNLTAILYPSPALAGTLTLHYYRLPVDPRNVYVDETQVDPDTVTLELPEGWVETAILYAESRALRRDRDPRWQEAKSLYDLSFTNLYEITRRHTDQNGQQIGNGAYPQVNNWLYESDY